MLTKIEDYVDFYTEQFQVESFTSLYEILTNKPVILLAPFLFDLIRELRKKVVVYADFIIEKDLINIASSHFEDYWGDKLVRVFSVELAIIAQEFSVSIDNDFSFLDYFNSSQYKESFVDRYPVLMELASIYCKHYFSFISTLLNRIASDFSDLKNHFLSSNDQWHLKKIYLSGDSHHFGQRVSILLFSNNTLQKKVVYKPKSASNLLAFMIIANNITQYSKTDLFFPRVLDKENYHWVEYIENHSCKNSDELALFYYRFGMLSAITLLLRGFDLHNENLIAMGDHPCIVDYECFFMPFLRLSEQKNMMSNAKNMPNINDTLLTPYVKDDMMDASALTGAYAYEEKILKKDPDIFSKFLNKTPDENNGNSNLNTHNKPHLNNAYQDPYFFLEDIKAGLLDTGHHIIKNKAAIFSMIENTIKSRPIFSRIVPKPTEYYNEFINELFHPKLLHSYEEFNDFLNQIENNYSNLSIKNSEILQMRHLDIPSFYASSLRDEVVDSYANQIKHFIYESYLDSLKTFLYENFSDHYIKLQGMLLEQSFEIRRMNFKTIPHRYFEKQSDFSRHCENGNSFSRHCEERSDEAIQKNPQKFTNKIRDQKTFLLNTARKLLDKIMEFSIDSAGSIVWPHAQERVSTKEQVFYDFQYTDSSLYSGDCGIALAFFYAHKIFNHAPYKDFFERLMTSIKINFDRNKASISVFSGLGQYLYLLAILNSNYKDGLLRHCTPRNDDGEHSDLKNELFLTLKTDLSKLLSKDKILDIIQGVAGFLVIACKAAQLFPDILSSDMLSKCVNHLMDQFNEINRTQNNSLILHPGLSHGITGLIWAVFHANLILKDKKINDFLKKLIHIERSFFDNKKANWKIPDLIAGKVQSTSAFERHWCHGAIGILLSRTDLYLHGYKDDLISKELSLASKALELYGFPTLMNPCHGKLAHIDLSIQLAKCNFTTTMTLESLANKIHKELASEHYLINHNNPLVFEASLMTGSAGLAYQIMRIFFPKNVPSILLLDVMP